MLFSIFILNFLDPWQFSNKNLPTLSQNACQKTVLRKPLSFGGIVYQFRWEFQWNCRHLKVSECPVRWEHLSKINLITSNRLEIIFFFQTAYRHEFFFESSGKATSFKYWEPRLSTRTNCLMKFSTTPSFICKSGKMIFVNGTNGGRTTLNCPTLCSSLFS